MKEFFKDLKTNSDFISENFKMLDNLNLGSLWPGSETVALTQRKYFFIVLTVEHPVAPQLIPGDDVRSE